MAKKPSYEELEQKVKELEEKSVRRKEVEEGLRALLNASIETAMLVDTEGTILAINEIGAQRVGKSVEEILGLGIYDYLPHELADNRKSQGKQVARSGKPVRYQEEAEGRFFDINLYPVFDSKGIVDRIAVFASDITDRKHMEETLQKSHHELESRVEERTAELVLANEKLKEEKEGHQRSETELHKKTELNQIFLDNMPPVAMLQRPHTREIVASNKAGEEVGAVPGEICYETWGQSDSPCPWCLAPVLWETGEAQHSEPYGLGRFWDAHWIPVSDDLYLHYAFDITEHKRAEAALRESEETYRTLVEAIPHGIQENDVSGKITFSNGSHARMHGYEPGELVGKHIWDMLASNAKKEELRTYLAMLVKDQPPPTPYITQDHTKDGGIIDVQVDLLYKRDKSGNVTGFISFITDITEHKRAEEALRQSEERYRLLIENAKEIIASININGEILFVNEAAAAYIGGVPKDFIGKTLWDIFPKQNADARMADTLKVIRSGKGQIKEYSIPFQGEMRCFLASRQPIRNGSGDINSVITLATDITDRKQTEQALREKEKELEIKSRNLEEINTALRVLLQKREDDKTKIEENMLSNVKELVEPYLEKLKKSRLDVRQMGYVSVLESNLNDIVSPFSSRLYSKFLNLSPSEVRVANLVKQGRGTKEIAGLMSLSSKTVATHRRNIRKKLGISVKKANLRTHLLSIQE